jgi:hypothetical protein
MVPAAPAEEDRIGGSDELPTSTGNRSVLTFAGSVIEADGRRIPGKRHARGRSVAQGRRRLQDVPAILGRLADAHPLLAVRVQYKNT